ncbi:MAG: phage major capsid protein [Acidimicrobiia bacterium]
MRKTKDFDLTGMSADNIIAAAKDIEGLVNKELASRQLDPLKIEPHSQPETLSADDVEYEKAFETYVRFGMERMPSDHRALLEDRWVQNESRAQGVGVGSEGGFTVPEGFVAKIKTAQKKFGGLRRASGIEFIPTATGNDLPYPNSSDVGNTGELLAENTAAAEQDVAFGQTVLKAFTWSSKMIRVSNQLLQDTGVSLDTWLAARLGERIGRVQAPFLITGTGSAQPEGIITNATVGVTTTTGQTTSFIYDDLVGMEASLDDAFLDDAVWVVSPDAVKQLRLVKDLDERPLLFGTDEGVAGQRRPKSLLGYPLFVDAEMAPVAASNLPILFGDLQNYAIRDVEGFTVRRLQERYAELNQTALIAFSRMDARPIGAGDDSYKTLQMAAS